MLPADLTLKPLNKLTKALTIALFSSAFLTGCPSSSSSSSSGEEEHEHEHEAHFTIIFGAADGSVLASFNAEEEELTDLNDGGDLDLSNQTIGGFLWWNDEGEQKAVVLNTAGYSFANHDADNQIAEEDIHYVAKVDEETESLVEETDVDIAELNTYLDGQKDIETEIADALAVSDPDATLCNFAVAHQEFQEREVDVHFALTDAGNVYLYEEDGTLQELDGQTVNPVPLGSGAIADCSKTGIAAASEEGVLIWVADTQEVYEFDSHSDDGQTNYHVHGSEEVSEFGIESNVDYAVLLGEGEGHEHDHDD